MNTNLTPKDYYNLALDYIFQGLDDKDYKRLKSGVIKKKDGNFTYEIYSRSSTNNYICHNTKSASVSLLDLIASIHTKEQSNLYQLRFCGAISQNAHREILKDYLCVDYEMLDKLIDDINHHFIKVTKILKDNPSNFIKSTNHEPIITADDYRYRIYFNENFFKIFGTADDVALFNKKKALFEQPINQAKTLCEQWIYFYTHNIAVTKKYAYSISQLYQCLDVIYDVFCDKHKTEPYYNFELKKYMYQYIKNRQITELELWILVTKFLEMTYLSEQEIKMVCDKLAQSTDLDNKSAESLFESLQEF